MCVAISLWNIRRFVGFWLILIINIFTHCAVVLLLPGSDFHSPGIIFAPLLAADIAFWTFVSVKVIKLLRI